jgi:hypothetical protein
MRDANTLQATAQQLSAGFGVAMAAIALRVGQPLGRLLPVHDTHATAYTLAFIMLALVSLMATLGATRLHPSAGNVLRRNATRPHNGREEAKVEFSTVAPAAPAAATQGATVSRSRDDG